MIIGKGAAYSRAEEEVRAFIDATRLPFLASPMGKGVVPDDHRLSVASARSHALGNADLIFLLGARLNWIMHFGLPPRFQENVRVIQLDIAPEEIGTNVPTEVALIGDAKAIVGQLNTALKEQPWEYPTETKWRADLAANAEENTAAVQAMLDDDSTPMGYYRVLREIRDLVPRDAIISSEGASTMDIGRTVLPNYHARHRLDAATFGTMGVGLGQAIAAAVVHPDKKVVAVEGDSAFGFSGMEVEVACRYQPADHVHHHQQQRHRRRTQRARSRDVPVSAYTPNAHYERVIEAFGGKGYFVTKPDELGPALKDALADPFPKSSTS